MFKPASHTDGDSGLMNVPTKLKEQTRPGSRRRRLLIAPAAVVAVVGLLVANAVAVGQQSAEATGDSTLPLDGGNIYVRQDGPRDAPAVVLIHGLAGSTRWWDSLTPLLARSHRVIRIDLLGHGQSAKPAGPGYEIPEQGRRVGQALDRLGVKHVIVVGHSTGGWVATALAEQRPDLVIALALIDTGPRLDADISKGPATQLMSVPIVGQLLWRLRTDSLIRKAASNGFSRPGYQIPQQIIDDLRGIHRDIAGSRRLPKPTRAPRPADSPQQAAAGDLRHGRPEMAILIRRRIRCRSRRKGRVAAQRRTLADARESTRYRHTPPRLHRLRARQPAVRAPLLCLLRSGKLRCRGSWRVGYTLATRLRLRLHEISEIVGGLVIMPASPAVITGFIAAASR